MYLFQIWVPASVNSFDQNILLLNIFKHFCFVDLFLLVYVLYIWAIVFLVNTNYTF